MTQSSTDSLVERLRDGFVVRSVSTPSAHGRTPDFAGTNALLTEAASRISTLERELEEARASSDALAVMAQDYAERLDESSKDNWVREGALEIALGQSKAALTAAEAKVARMGEALKTIDHLIGDSIRGNGEEDYTLIIGGERLKGPAVEFAGYALTTMQALARSALQSEKDRESGE